MQFQEKIYTLVKETFDEQEVLDIALYLISAQAVAEAAQQGVMGNKPFVENLPPGVLELSFKYDSALTSNKFFLENFTIFRSFAVFDKIKLAATTRLIVDAEKEKDKEIFKASERMIYSKLDSLVMLAFLWKGYDFAVDFAVKAAKTMDISPQMKEYFNSKLR